VYCTSVVGMYEVRVRVQRRDTGSGSGPDLEGVGRSPNSNAFRQQQSDARVQATVWYVLVCTVLVHTCALSFRADGVGCMHQIVELSHNHKINTNRTKL
jgi:hypothetical protein